MFPSIRNTAFSRGRRVALAGAVTVSLVATGFVTATLASADVPSAPSNLVVFPNRDFVTVEGYQDRIGQTATIEVRRGTGIVGSAQAVVVAGDVAFEINHPGGACWGAGTGLNVTPDIQPGDVTSISFDGVVVADTIAQDAYVTADSAVSTTNLTGDTVTITGHSGAGVITANTEQRIIEPALTDTAIGRRDVRALPGPVVPSDKGGYSSGMTFDAVAATFTATYVFDDPAVATIVAAAGGARLMAWQVVDGAGNRQGLTIAEYGELGGPGMGGCPNGPLQTGPAGPTSVSAANVAGGVKLTWTPAVAVPGTPEITGYRATAIAQTSTNGEQIEVGRRIAGQASTGTTIIGLSGTETYTIEVVSVSSVGLTFPPVTAIPVTDIVAPTVSASPAGGTFAIPQQVTLAANEPGSQIYYTLDGTDPVQIDGLSLTAVSYTAPLNVSATGPTTIKYVAFDPTGNVSLIGVQTYTITNTPTPDAPAFVANPVLGNGQITLSWTATDPTITGYGVQVYAADGTAVGAVKNTTVKTLVVSGLVEGTPYFFTVKAQNVNGYGLESAKLGPLSPQGAVVANAGPDQTAAVRNTVVRLTGAGSTVGTYAWTQLATGTVNPIATTSPDRVTLAGAGTLSPSFTLPYYKYPMANQPLTFRLAVTGPTGTRTDVVVITPRSDVVTIDSATWRSSQLRIRGTATTAGSIVTVRSTPNAAGVVTVHGTATVNALGTWELRIRNGAALPRTLPGPVFADSNRGGTAGPFTVTNG
jgi:Chitobiase/beta-hexosaminidase C-terminal domain/Fibronectin type III domain